MLAQVRLQSKQKGELNRFLSKFYDTNLEIQNEIKWIKEYKNPVEITDLIGVFIDNINKYDIKMWVNLDKDIYIKISEKNADMVIKYFFERYPY